MKQLKNPILEDLFNKGLKELRSNHAGKAVGYFQQIITSDPKNADAHFYLGIALRILGKINQSQISLEKSAELNPQSSEIHYQLSLTLSAAKKHQEAIKQINIATNLQPNSPNILSALAFLQLELGENRTAIRNFRKAIKLEPTSASRYHNLAGALIVNKENYLAIEALRKSITLDPSRNISQLHLANILLESRYTKEATSIFESLIEKNPSDYKIREKLGDLFIFEGRYAKAKEMFSIALHLAPKELRLSIKLAESLSRMSRGEEALAIIKKSNKEPNTIALEEKTGEILERMGRFTEAEKKYKEILARDSSNIWALSALVEMGRPLTPNQEKKLNSAATSNKTSEKSKISANFALGTLLDSKGHYKKAFPYFLKGNELCKNAESYDVKSHRDFVNSIINLFSREFVNSQKEIPSNSELPIIIIGMPRSGTTLVEQIIASHSKVFSGGELQDLDLVRNRLEENTKFPFPRNIQKINLTDLKLIRDEFIEHRRSLSPNAARIIDKTPSHVYGIGLMAILFPNAKIIYCRRNILDTCVSMYFHNFSGSHNYSFDLQTLGHYVTDYERLMKHWKLILPIFEIEYENIINDTESNCRNLINYLDLDWEENVLNYRSNINFVSTASRWQVRQPIYSSSLNRWENYSEFLSPLKSILRKSNQFNE